MNIIKNTVFTKCEPAGTAAEMRAMAARLIEIANSMETAGAAEGRTITLAQAIKDETVLALAAEAESRSRKRRSRFIPDELIRGAAWDILLNLFVRQVRGIRVSVKSACDAADVPADKASSWISALEECRFIRVYSDGPDGRSWYAELTIAGFLAVARCLNYQPGTHPTARETEVQDSFRSAN